MPTYSFSGTGVDDATKAPISISGTLKIDTPPPQPTQPAEKFGFIYPAFKAPMTAQEFVKKFVAAMHHPESYLYWINAGTDIRKLNPSGVYLKHINLRTIVSGSVDLSHPDYNWIHQNHPEWIIRDANGNTVPMFAANSECLDFANDAYLDYALKQWMPNTYLDETDKDPNKVNYYLQDNGNFLKQQISCKAGDAACTRYTTDSGMQGAWKHMLDRWRAAWPNKKIFVNTGPVSYQTPAVQLPYLKDVLSHADGYFSESLTSDHVYWSTQPNSQKRNALETTMQLADWLAANNKYFFPNLGPGDGVEPTQAETDYGYAFFNLMRRGDKQFYSQICKDNTGAWVPEVYPEMTLALGAPLEERTEITGNVYRRKFEKATAYVNLDDISANITLPAGTNKNSRGQAVSSPLSLPSFSGLTVYTG